MRRSASRYVKCLHRPELYSELSFGYRAYAVVAPIGRRQKNAQKSKSPSVVSKPVWPVDLIAAASNSEGLNITPATAITTLEELWSLKERNAFTTGGVKPVLEC
jgi:hypothetical protein